LLQRIGIILGGIVILGLVIYFILVAICGWKVQCGGSDKSRLLMDLLSMTRAETMKGDFLV